MAQTARNLWITTLTVAACLLTAVPGFAEDRRAGGQRGGQQGADQAPAVKKPAPPKIADVLAGLAGKDTAKRLTAAQQAKDLDDKRLVKALVKLLKDDQRVVRDAVVEALGARKNAADQKSVASALHKRLVPLSKSADDESELAVVIQALHDLAQPSSVKPLIDGIDQKTSKEISSARLMAVANIPIAAAIEALIAFQSRGRRRGSNGQRQNANLALRYATGEKMRDDPDVWRAWWKENAKTFSFQAAKEQREVDAQKRADRDERKERNRKRREEKKNGKRKKPGADGQGGRSKDDGSDQTD